MVKRAFLATARAATVALSCAMAACTATGQITDAQRSAFIEAKGGVYDNKVVTAYVQALTDRLAVHANLPPDLKRLSVTVLDTAEPSAYALAGNTLYVSRGLIAFSNNEAELAGVMAHEIAHVSARHLEEEAKVRARLVRDAVAEARDELQDTVARSRRVAVLERALASRIGELSAYSREAELEADRLSAAIVSAAGYDPSRLADMVERLYREQTEAVERIGLAGERLAKVRESSDYPDLSVRIAALSGMTTPPGAVIERERLMAMVDGMPYGERYGTAYVRDGRFWSPETNTSIAVPAAVYPYRGDDLMMIAADGIFMLMSETDEDSSLDNALAALQDNESEFREPEVIEVNGIRGLVTGASIAGDDGPSDFTVTMFEIGPTLHSLLMVVDGTKPLPPMAQLYEDIQQSFRVEAPGALPPPPAVKTRLVQPGETVQSLARQSAVYRGTEDDFRLFNGLGTDEQIAPGQWIKLVE